ncbi:tyrosine-type recombinase/integrase [Angustibacter sp. McL0619]|uniref:tyrosine-type recombinase/integrase n=1 Tax=Angustibacter sp. McL0619 TaxID=3415676 RepID=UPI003CEB40E3
MDRIRLHDLRHTALTLMTLQGVPLPVVAAWAGHADAAFTLRTYAHSQPSALAAASDALTNDWARSDREIPVRFQQSTKERKRRTDGFSRGS